MIVTAQDSYATGSTILNPSLDNLSESVAKRIATRLKCQIFASIQTPHDLCGPLEGRLLELLKALMNHKKEGESNAIGR